MKGVGMEVLLSMFACVMCVSKYIPCPKTHIERGRNCCKPTFCSEYEGFKACKGTAENPGSDTCVRCPDGQLSGDTVNTKDLPEGFQLCHIPDCQCPPEADIMNFKDCTTTGAKKLCQCSTRRGFYGLDPYICKVVNAKKMKEMQKPGHELLLTGEVRECVEGFFKSKNDNSSCIPYKKCQPGYEVKFAGSKVKDRECVPEIFTTDESKDKNISTLKSKEDTSLPGIASTDEGGGPNSSGNDRMSSSPVLWVILLPVLVFVVTGFIVLFIIWIKKSSSRRNKSNVECYNNTRDTVTVNHAISGPSPPNENENAGLLHFLPQQSHNSSLSDSSQQSMGQVDPPVHPTNLLPEAQPPNHSIPGLPGSQSMESAQQPTEVHLSLDNEDQVSLNGSAVNFSILDEKTENLTGRPIGRVIPQRTEIEDVDGQIHAYPEQEDSGELYVGGQSMYGGFETVQLSPIQYQHQSDEEETISKETY